MLILIDTSKIAYFSRYFWTVFGKLIRYSKGYWISVRVVFEESEMLSGGEPSHGANAPSPAGSAPGRENSSAFRS